MRRISIAILLTGCTAATQQVAIDGAGSDFCVPRQFTISPPWWVPEDKPGTPNGFAFEGCWHAKPDRLPCPFPSAVISGTVHGTNHRRPTTYGAFPADSFLSSVLREEGTTFQLYDSGGVVSAQNLRLWQDWYLWKLQDPAKPGEHVSFRKDDRLIASCRFGNSVYKPIGAGPQNIFCDRNFDHGPLAIHYSFEAPEVFPRNIASMDRSIIATLTSWQCGKRSDNSFKPKPLRGSA